MAAVSLARSLVGQTSQAEPASTTASSSDNDSESSDSSSEVDSGDYESTNDDETTSPMDNIDPQLQAQLALLHMSSSQGLNGSAVAESDEKAAKEARGCPVFSPVLLDDAGSNGVRSLCPPQYGLLAANITPRSSAGDATATDIITTAKESRIFQNVSAPSSAFICGSQGSGKSHTLSCMLENCLLPSQQGCLPKPLAGVVFHYDTFTSDVSGTPCEAAYLASNPALKVRVLCSPTNIATIKRTYLCVPQVVVEPLQLDEHDLNTRRMLELMAANEGGLPLYLHVVLRILRDMRAEQQQESLSLPSGGSGASLRFNYAEFKRRIYAENLQIQQSISLQQRLDTLESFMVKEHTAPSTSPGQQMSAKEQIGLKKKKAKQTTNARKPGTNWQLKPGQLTIVDLSCPCVTQEQACSLFNICLSLFLEQGSSSPNSTTPPPVGKVIALDEAHKYMGEQSPECLTLTESLLATIRLQRHLGARLFISTQEPTISPKLLDLCNVTIVHRFTSPDWLRMLSGHLAGISSSASVAIAMMDEADREKRHGVAQIESSSSSAAYTGDLSNPGSTGRTGIHLNHSLANPAAELFSYIVRLETGEALLFAPSAIVGIGKREEGPGPLEFKRLGHEVLKISVRKRLTADGGVSIMAD